jgi:hypothetical protein
VYNAHISNFFHNPLSRFISTLFFICDVALKKAPRNVL